MVREPNIEVGVAYTVNGWNTLANPEGLGNLKGIGVADVQQGRHKVRITIDGEELTSNKIAASGTGGGNVGMSFGHPFYEELKVEVKNMDHKVFDTKFWASYVLGTDE